MTIEERPRTRSLPNENPIDSSITNPMDPSVKEDPSVKDSFQNIPCPTGMDSVSTLDLRKAKKIQKEVAEKGTSPHADDEEGSRVMSISRQVLGAPRPPRPPRPPRSPRSLLQERRSRDAIMQEEERGRREAVEQALKKCPSRDIIHRSEPISLEELSTSVFDMEKYRGMEVIKRSRSKSFNKFVIERLLSSMEGGGFQQINATFINDLVKANVRKTVDSFMNNNNIEDLSSTSNADLGKCSLIIARNLFACFCTKERLYTFIHRNLLSLKMEIATILKEKNWKNRSEWLDELVESMEYVLSLGASPTENYKVPEEMLQSLKFYEYFISQIKEPSIKSILLKAIHPDEDEALMTLKRLTRWGSDEGHLELVTQVRSAISLYMNHVNVQSQLIPFNDNDTLKKMMENVDWYQVARSYLMSTKRNYSVLTVNDRDIKDTGVNGKNERECQQQFYSNFLKILYEEGVGTEASKGFAHSQAEAFLKQEPFLGREILAIGSNSGWGVCDVRLRKMYPLLFNATYRTRMNQGTKCHIQVESPNKYSILVSKTYTTFPPPEGVDATQSFAIDDTRPICDIQVSWQVNYKADEGWSDTISTPSVRRKKANDEQWEAMQNILLAPDIVKGMVVDMPEDDQLKNALKALM